MTDNTVMPNPNANERKKKKRRKANNNGDKHGEPAGLLFVRRKDGDAIPEVLLGRERRDFAFYANRNGRYPYAKDRFFYMTPWGKSNERDETPLDTATRECNEERPDLLDKRLDASIRHAIDPSSNDCVDDLIVDVEKIKFSAPNDHQNKDNMTMFIVTVPYAETLVMDQRLSVSAFTPAFPYGFDWHPVDELPAFTAHVVHHPLSRHGLCSTHLGVSETVAPDVGIPMGASINGDDADPNWNLIKSKTALVNGARYIEPIDIPAGETYVTNAGTGDGKSYAIQRFVREKMRSEDLKVIHLCSFIAQIITETDAYRKTLPGLEDDSTYAPVDDVYDKYYINKCKNEHRKENHFEDKETKKKYDGPCYKKDSFVATYESLAGFSEIIWDIIGDGNYILVMDEIFSGVSKHNSPTTQDKWHGGLEVWKLLYQQAKYCICASADIGVETFDPKAFDTNNPQYSPWDIAVRHGGIVKLNLLGMGPERKCNVYSYSTTKNEREYTLVDDHDYPYWIMKADKSKGDRLFAFFNSKKECQKFGTIVRNGFSKELLECVGGEEGSTKDKHDKLGAHLYQTLTDVDVWTMTNATAHGLDTYVIFMKGLLTTKTFCAGMTQTHQAAGRMNRANNLKIIELDVKLGSKDSIKRLPKSLAECRDQIAREIKDQQVTKTKRQAEGHRVVHKPLQYHEPYVREINAWLLYMQELSDYSHETEFKRQAAFYHAKVTDARVKTDGKDKGNTLEIINKDYYSQYDDQAPGLWDDGTRTKISCQFMSSVAFLSTVSTVFRNPHPVQTTLVQSNETGELIYEQQQREFARSVDPMLIERSTYTIVKDAALSARAADIVLPLIELAMKKVSDDQRAEEEERRKKKPNQKKKTRITYASEVFESAMSVLRKYEQEQGGDIAVALARALFQFCIRDEFRDSVPVDSRDKVCRALHDISALILNHHGHVTSVISSSEHVQKMFKTLLSCSYEETFGKTIENAREFYTMDTMNYSIVSIGKMFRPPILPSYGVFKKMSSDELFLRQINVRSLLRAFGDNECHRNAWDCLRFHPMIVPEAEERVRGDSDGNTYTEEFHREPLSRFMQAVDNTGDERNYAPITSHFINLLRFLSGEHDVTGVPVPKDPNATATTVDTMSLTDGGPIADHLNDELCKQWDNGKEDNLFVKRLKYFAWNLKVGSLSSGVGKSCTVAQVVRKLLKAGMLTIQRSNYQYTITPLEDAIILGDHFTVKCPVRSMKKDFGKYFSAVDLNMLIKSTGAQVELNPPMTLQAGQMKEFNHTIAKLYTDMGDQPLFRGGTSGSSHLRPNPNAFTRAEIWTVDTNAPEQKAALVRMQENDNVIAEVKDLDAAKANHLSTCIVSVDYAYKRSSVHGGEGRLYANTGLQTVSGADRRAMAWQSYLCEIDQSAGHQTLGYQLGEHLLDQSVYGDTVGFLRKFVETRDEEFIKPLVDAYGLEKFAESPKKAFKIVKNYYLTIWMGGSQKSWVRATMIDRVKQVLSVTDGEAERIWTEVYGRLNSTRSNMVQLAKKFTAPPSKKRSADGQVVERQYKPYSAAELVKAIEQALALGDHIDSADIETKNEDIYDKTIDYARAVKKLRKGLLKLPQHRRFTDMCKTTSPGGEKVWKLRDDDGKLESELTAFHYLLSYYEVPMLLWTADFFNERDWYMDVYIHDGSLIRRREFAKDKADAQAQLEEFQALGLVGQCEQYVRDMMKTHYGVPVRPTLGMKSLTE